MVQKRFEPSLPTPLVIAKADHCDHFSQELVMKSARNGTSVAPNPVSRTDEFLDLQPFNDIKAYAMAYTRERPGVMLMTCFGLGFIVGWKLKPW